MAILYGKKAGHGQMVSRATQLRHDPVEEVKANAAANKKWMTKEDKPLSHVEKKKRRLQRQKMKAHHAYTDGNQKLIPSTVRG